MVDLGYEVILCTNAERFSGSGCRRRPNHLHAMSLFLGIFCPGRLSPWLTKRPGHGGISPTEPQFYGRQLA